ncbi:aspartate Aminotransferase, partial [Candidatus Sulcia muelleri str. Hc (Homalodisca coagulata)]
EEGYHYDTPISGMGDLKKKIGNKSKRDNNINNNISQIVISKGVKQSIINPCRSS